MGIIQLVRRYLYRNRPQWLSVKCCLMIFFYTCLLPTHCPFYANNIGSFSNVALSLLCKGCQIFFVVLYIFMEIILDHFHSSLSLLSFSFLFFNLLYPMRLFLCVGIANFTRQQLQTNGCVLKHQAISIHSADWMFIVLDQFHTEALYLWGITLEIKITFWMKVT